MVDLESVALSLSLMILDVSLVVFISLFDNDATKQSFTALLVHCKDTLGDNIANLFLRNMIKQIPVIVVHIILR